MYRLSEKVKHSPIDNRVRTVDDVAVGQLQYDISNDVLPSIVNDQNHHSKLGKHRRMRKGSRMYQAVAGRSYLAPNHSFSWRMKRGRKKKKSYFENFSVDDALLKVLKSLK